MVTMMDDRYNPVTDTYNPHIPVDELSETQRKSIAEAEIRREIENKRKREFARDAAIAAHDQYLDDLARLEQSRQQKEYEHQQFLNKLKESEQIAEKQARIREAKRRYENLSFFKKLFTKKIDYFKQGIGYYKSSDMTIDQIDNLYQGKSR